MATSVMDIGFYITVGIAGLLIVSDALMLQFRGQSLLPIIPLYLGGTVFLFLSVVGLTGITPYWFDSFITAAPRLGSLDRINQFVMVSMIVLLLFIVGPKWYLDIDESPTIRTIINLTHSNR